MAAGASRRQELSPPWLDASSAPPLPHLPSPAGHVAAFAAAQGVSMARHRLAAGMRRTVLEDLGQTLAAAGLEDRDLLQVVPAP